MTITTMTTRRIRFQCRPALSVLIFILLSGTAFGANPGAFPTKKIYVPCYHSRPFFIKNLRPDSASPIKKLSINEPEIAEAKIITPYQLVIDGRHPGSTMCIIWYEDGTLDFLEIRVTNPKPGFAWDVEVIKGTKSSVRDSLFRVIW